MYLRVETWTLIQPIKAIQRLNKKKMEEEAEAKGLHCRFVCVVADSRSCCSLNIIFSFKQHTSCAYTYIHIPNHGVVLANFTVHLELPVVPRPTGEVIDLISC